MLKAILNEKLRIASGIAFITEISKQTISFGFLSELVLKESNKQRLVQGHHPSAVKLGLYRGQNLQSAQAKERLAPSICIYYCEVVYSDTALDKKSYFEYSVLCH